MCVCVCLSLQQSYSNSIGATVNRPPEPGPNQGYDADKPDSLHERALGPVHSNETSPYIGILLSCQRISVHA